MVYMIDEWCGNHFKVYEQIPTGMLLLHKYYVKSEGQNIFFLCQCVKTEKDKLNKPVSIIQ